MLTITIAAICTIVLVAVVTRDGPGDGISVAPWLALVTGACWAIFWRPHVAVSDGGVRLVNVLRTIELPWPAIQAIDTKWALTMITAYGKFTAWAAPAPGARTAARASRADTRHLPSSTYTGEGIRPGDLPTSPSGEAAAIIRNHWEKLRDAGHLDDPRLEHERVPIHWHVRTLAAGAGLTALGLLTLRI